MLFKGINKKEISFPLGGIGTGSMGLSGSGYFRDIEIMSKPNKGSEGRFTHFAIKAEDDEKVLDARVLSTDLIPGYVGNFERPKYTGYGWGPDRGTMAGFPHFENGDFDGKFPFAVLDFEDRHFPGKVVMTAFNPLIPGNENDSSIPGGFFTFEINNITDKPLKYSIAISCNNYYAKGNAINSYYKKNGRSYIYLSNDGDKKTTEYGDLTIATDSPDISYQEYWFRGSWFDNSGVFWKDFSAFGKLKNRHYSSSDRGYEVYKENDIATLAAHVEVEPHTSKTVHFVMTWSNPYMNNTWEITDPGINEKEIERRRKVIWKNYYAVMFEDSRNSAEYSLENFSRLYKDTRLYEDLIYSSSLPPAVLDAVTANVAIIKSTTCLRLEDGSFYAFEGVHPHMGSCEGTCTHVWSYSYALAFLFPNMERSARKLEYSYSIQPDGGMGFRLMLPIGVKPTSHRPAVDGQFGTVLRTYREYLISGDDEWLKGIWPEVKKTIQYAWNDTNPDKWDADKDGIMEGRQHQTLDMELFSANSWLSGMYLAGLKAGIKMAEILKDEPAKEEFASVFNSGVKILNNKLFNGKYYIQRIDLKDKTLLEKYTGGMSTSSQDVMSSYWDEEHGQIKYQIGEGSSIDQVLGQWHADLLDLGDVFDKDKVDSALHTIYNENYIRDMRNHVNPCRIYALNDESGTIICAYPKGAEKPVISVPYAEETMHGFEYAVASHMIMHGMEKEGLQCVKAVRDRYDGRRRNPYSEIECGSTYARSLASYALLLVYSGFQFDMGKKYIGFRPLHQEAGSWFWSLNSGFGRFTIADGTAKLELCYGLLTVSELCMNAMTNKTLSINGKTLSYKPLSDGKISLNEAITLMPGDALVMGTLDNTNIK